MVTKKRDEGKHKGLLALLTPEQRKQALEYRGPDCFGDHALVPRKLIAREPTSAMIDAVLDADRQWSVNSIPRLERALRAAWDAAESDLY